MTYPRAKDLFAANEATWPPARVMDIQGWRVRFGAGGGRRVSSATATEPNPDIMEMEAAQAALGQTPLVMVYPGEAELDRRLGATGYKLIYPTDVMVMDLDQVARPPQPLTAFSVQWPPLQVQREIWANGGIGPQRIAVMERVACLKTSLLGRTNDRPVGTTFVAISQTIAMVHGLEVHPEQRKRGVARNMMLGAAQWAQDHGAKWLCVLVTQANDPAISLYSSLGMLPTTRYHYRSRHSDP